MANSEPRDVSTSILQEDWKKNVNNSDSLSKTYHKSLDFSNVGINEDSTGEGALKRFHQMTIYIKNPRLLSHGGFISTSTRTATITSNLPEKISYNFGSKWETPLNFTNATTNLLMQLGGELLNENLPSGINRVTTLKVWGGSQPLSLELTIPVIDDIANGEALSSNSDGRYTNLVEALEFLGSLCLPTYSGGNKYGFYTPPPSPLNVNFIYDRYVSNGKDSKPTLETQQPFTLATGGYGRIMVQLGGVLLIDNCLIESVSVNYPNTKAMIKHTYANGISTPAFYGNSYLHPLLATVTLKISTVEALTAETYSKMLWAKPQKDQGRFTGNIAGTGIGKTLAAMLPTKNKVEA